LIGDAPRILSVATALPPYRVGQEEAKTFARGMFSRRDGDFERLLPIFDNVNVDNRYFCVPVEWFERDHGFPEKNALYVEHAFDLSEKAARRALDRVGAGPEDVGAIFFVSTTGISTPSLDSKLIFRLGLSEHTRRVPIWGLGCSAGAAGIARVAVEPSPDSRLDERRVRLPASGSHHLAHQKANCLRLAGAVIGDG
jgi:alkylresorcinol/alkylpyrone synthase